MQILNHRDYRLAKTRRAQLERATSQQAIVESFKDPLPADLSASRIETLRAELTRINAEIETYERLRASSPDAIETIEADELGLLPILGRIARQLSQRELGDLLGLKEQQIQRYENDRYATVSLARYQRILSVLEVEVHPRLSPKRPEVASSVSNLDVDLSPELLRDLRNRGWVDLPRSLSKSEMIERLSLFVAASQKHAQTTGLHRRTLKTSEPEAVLRIWTARVLTVASERRGRMKGKFNIADTTWLQRLIRLSVFPDGPRRAADMLKEHGIILVIEPHLPHTLLDGAAFVLSGGIPVIALTIRHDRIDNFWFTLLHELGHVFLHFSKGLQEGFLDDDLGDAHVSDIEREADDFARTKLIPDEIWATSVARFSRSEDAIKKLASTLNIHPAIVAGRIRNERDYKLFSNLVGSGQVRALFAGYTP